MASADKLVSIAALLLLGTTATIAAVVVPVSFACPFGQVFEFDGCVPSPQLYQWDSSSPTAVKSPPSCIWDMPWGRVSLPCNFMNCLMIFYPDGYGISSQSVTCSSLTVNVQRLVNNVPVPIKDHDVLVSANLTCKLSVGASFMEKGEAFINVTMLGKTDSGGAATFLVPSSLGNHSSGSPHLSCYTLDWFSVTQSGGLIARDLNSGAVSADIPWPSQQDSLVIWLPPISTVVLRQPRGCFIL